MKQVNTTLCIRDTRHYDDLTHFTHFDVTCFSIFYESDYTYLVAYIGLPEMSYALSFKNTLSLHIKFANDFS